MAPSPRMAESVPARDRWLALGLLLALLALAYGVLVHPWWTVPMRAAGERLAAAQQREQRVGTLLRQAPEVTARLQQWSNRQGGIPGFLVEASPELATASLIQRLEAVVAAASPGNRSCAITNRSPVEPDSREPYTRVTVQVRLRCGTAELTGVLHALESGAPRLFVGNLNILAQRLYFAPGGGAPPANGGLDVTFDLYGYLAPPVGVPDAR